jgi:hypothetical protein
MVFLVYSKETDPGRVFAVGPVSVRIEVTDETLKQLWRRRLMISLRDRRSIHHVTHDEIVRASVTALLAGLEEVVHC